MAEKKTTKKFIENISKMDLNTLNKELKEAEKNLFSLKMKHKSDELKQSHLIKNLRRYIAKIKWEIIVKNT